jgi:hypothetical protein
MISESYPPKIVAMTMGAGAVDATLSYREFRTEPGFDAASLPPSYF